jgi:enoyl-CoA hydratase/carnithine racemase
VNEVVPSDSLMKRSRELAGKLIENSPSSVRLTKKLINSFISQALDDQMQQAIEENAAIRQTSDFREGVSSFLEKRKPRWSGQ